MNAQLKQNIKLEMKENYLFYKSSFKQNQFNNKKLNIQTLSFIQRNKQQNKSQGIQDIQGEIDYDFGIIFIKPQDQKTELPIFPIIAIRNSLGTKEGESGIEIKREEYLKYVDFLIKICFC